MKSMISLQYGSASMETDSIWNWLIRSRDDWNETRMGWITIKFFQQMIEVKFQHPKIHKSFSQNSYFTYVHNFQMQSNWKTTFNVYYKFNSKTKLDHW